MESKKRALAPKGGDDKVYTPDALACQIVSHFNPSGLVIDPCSGQGAFPRAFESENLDFISYEIDYGTDFLKSPILPGAWVITNPPWSQFRAFLAKSMETADNVVFLALLNAWFMRARVRDIKEAGFGYKSVLLLETPPKPWPQTGFQLAAVHIQKGWTGNFSGL